jgi:hypothetical protein
MIGHNASQINRIPTPTCSRPGESPPQNPQRRRSSANWASVTESDPCRICGSDDWCSRTRDGGTHSCRRASSSALFGKGVSKPDNGGPKWLFFDRAANRAGISHVSAKRSAAIRAGISDDAEREPESSEVYPDITHRAVKFADDCTAKKLEELGTRNGVPTWALKDFPLIGWDKDKRTWMLPEVDGAERTIGLARRGVKGAKGFLYGTKAGLFTSPGWREHTGDIYIVEGQTDVMALHAAGLCAIGRPSALARIPYLVELLRDVSASRKIIVVGERELKADGTWCGRAAAYSVAAKLAAGIGREVYWAPHPPGTAKDSRAWLTKQAITRAEKDRLAKLTTVERALETCNPRIVVTQSRARWAKLGEQFAAGVLALAVAVQPDMADPPRQRQECKCSTPFLVQIKGKANTNAAGKRAVIDARCFRWSEASCRTWWANRWSAWLWRCLVSYGDPARCPEPSEQDLFPWPTRPDAQPAGPWGLYTGIVTAKRFKQIRTALTAVNTVDERNAEYVRVRLDRPAAPRLHSETGAFVEIQKTQSSPCSSTKAPVSRCTSYRVVVALRPGVPVPRGLTPIAAGEAAEVLSDALHAIMDMDRSEAKYNRPVSASAGWKLPDTAARSGNWTIDAKSGARAKKGREVHTALGVAAAKEIAAEGIQDSAVRHDAHVGGELASYLLVQMLTPEHCGPDTDPADIAFRHRRWRPYLDHLTDGDAVRQYLARHAGHLPGPDDKAALLAAVQQDVCRSQAEAALQAEFGDLLTGYEWATERVLRTVRAGRLLIDRIDRRITHPIRRAVAAKRVQQAVNRRLRAHLRGYLGQMQLPDAERYTRAALRLKPWPPRTGTMFEKRAEPQPRNELHGLAAIAH